MAQHLVRQIIHKEIRQFCAAEVQHLKELRRAQQMSGVDSARYEGSIALSKATLHVYYAVLHGDKERCRASINAARELFSDELTSIMENDSFVAVNDFTTKDTTNDYKGTKRDENTRQVAAEFKRKMENFELFYENM